MTFVILLLRWDMLKLNVNSLRKAFYDFHILTNMKIALYDASGNPVLSYPKEDSAFCQMLESHPIWCKKCSDCDKMNFDASKKAGRELHYTCHLGLSEAVVPIYNAGDVIGYVMLGQVLTTDTADIVRARLKSTFCESEFPNIYEAIDAIPTKTTTELDASITVLKSLATYFLSNKWLAPLKNEFIVELDNYILQNLNHTITARDICSAFHICRTTLYALAKEYLGRSIADYVQNFRIRQSCKMLTETTKPITYIAYATGFSDYGHFSRVFKKIKGVSASTYRKTCEYKND